MFFNETGREAICFDSIETQKKENLKWKTKMIISIGVDKNRLKHYYLSYWKKIKHRYLWKST